MMIDTSLAQNACQQSAAFFAAITSRPSRPGETEVLEKKYPTHVELISFAADIGMTLAHQLVGWAGDWYRLLDDLSDWVLKEVGQRDAVRQEWLVAEIQRLKGFHDDCRTVSPAEAADSLLDQVERNLKNTMVGMALPRLQNCLEIWEGHPPATERERILERGMTLALAAAKTAIGMVQKAMSTA